MDDSVTTPGAADALPGLFKNFKYSGRAGQNEYDASMGYYPDHIHSHLHRLLSIWKIFSTGVIR